MKLFSPAVAVDPVQYFGLHRHEITEKFSNLKGMIYDGEVTVSAAQDGIVRDVGYSKKYGHFVLIQHEEKLYTFYAYGVAEPPLKKGQRIESGEFVFDSGKVGDAERPQFYFEVRTKKNGGQVDPLAHLFPFRVYPGILDPEQASLEVNGKMNRATWKAWQNSLKANRTWEYAGMVDGVPGPMTWEAIRRSIEGLFDETSTLPIKTAIIQGVQARLYDLGFYAGDITGKLDKETVCALQRTFNAGKYR